MSVLGPPPPGATMPVIEVNLQCLKRAIPAGGWPQADIDRPRDQHRVATFNPW